MARNFDAFERLPVIVQDALRYGLFDWDDVAVYNAYITNRASCLHLTDNQYNAAFIKFLESQEYAQLNLPQYQEKHGVSTALTLMPPLKTHRI